MGDRSGIEWTEATWNPTTGCDRTSPGCDNCYALTLAKRLKAMGQVKYQQDGGPTYLWPRLRTDPSPRRFATTEDVGRSRTIFVNSMSDLFHPEVPLGYIRQVFDVIAETPQHTYQVLTKRSRRLARRRPAISTGRRTCGWGKRRERPVLLPDRAPSDRASRRPVPLLRAAPRPSDELDLQGIDWVIAGGESGGNARRMAPDWCAVDPRPVSRRRRGLLLQAMGRADPESARAGAGRGSA